LLISAVVLVAGCQKADDSTAKSGTSSTTTSGDTKTTSDNISASDFVGKWLTTNGPTSGTAEIKADGTFIEHAVVKQSTGIVTVAIIGTYKMQGKDMAILHSTKVAEATGSDPQTQADADKIKKMPLPEIKDTLKWNGKDDIMVSSDSGTGKPILTEWKRAPN
jgi:hypothetical protein